MPQKEAPGSGTRSQSNANMLSFVNNRDDTENQSCRNPSFAAIIHHSLTNLIIVRRAIILVTVYYKASSVIRLAFAYICL